MRAGGLDVAAFTIPTAFFGLAGLKAFHDRWPIRTWFSAWARLEHQLSKMESLADSGAITVTADAGELREQKGLYGFHGIEGAHALESDVGRVRELAGRGVVFIGPVHLRNNAFGGSSSGSDRGLTALGKSLVMEMNRAGVLLDLAHASSKTFAESLALTELPPLVSHSGVRAVHDTWRNLGDDQIRAVASRGGVIGVMLAPPALNHASLEEVLRHIEHVIAVGGEDAVAIGSDFDGYVTPPIGADSLPALTELMLRRGFSDERIRKVLGGNVVRLLQSRDTLAPVAAKFTISKGRNAKYYFNLKGPNGEIILASQGYAGRDGCRKGIESVRTNSRVQARFEAKTSKRGQSYFVLKAKNGQVVGQSQMYKTERSCTKGMQSVRKNARTAKLAES